MAISASERMFTYDGKPFEGTIISDTQAKKNRIDMMAAREQNGKKCRSDFLTDRQASVNKTEKSLFLRKRA